MFEKMHILNREGKDLAHSKEESEKKVHLAGGVLAHEGSTNFPLEGRD